MRFLSPRSQSEHFSYKSGFTLVELLVVIGIIALLISILLPSLNAARKTAASVKSLSNLRQLALGLELYRNDNRGFYPVAAWPQVAGKPRIRWADAIYEYMRYTEIYMSPLIDDGERQRMKKPFAHTCNPDGTTNADTVYYGGYGYNYQYLGNGRHNVAWPSPYKWAQQANAKDIRNSAETIAIADTNGSKDGTNFYTSEGVYTIDPPLGSVDLGSKGSRINGNGPGNNNSYYRASNDETGPDFKFRSTPAERNKGKVNIVFCDGHGESWTLNQMDNLQPDGTRNNRYWNGQADPNRR